MWWSPAPSWIQFGFGACLVPGGQVSAVGAVAVVAGEEVAGRTRNRVVGAGAKGAASGAVVVVLPAVFMLDTMERFWRSLRPSGPPMICSPQAARAAPVGYTCCCSVPLVVVLALVVVLPSGPARPGSASAPGPARSANRGLQMQIRTQTRGPLCRPKAGDLFEALHRHRRRHRRAQATA